MCQQVYLGGVEEDEDVLEGYLSVGFWDRHEDSDDPARAQQ